MSLTHFIQCTEFYFSYEMPLPFPSSSVFLDPHWKLFSYQIHLVLDIAVLKLVSYCSNLFKSWILGDMDSSSETSCWGIRRKEQELRSRQLIFPTFISLTHFFNPSMSLPKCLQNLFALPAFLDLQILLVVLGHCERKWSEKVGEKAEELTGGSFVLPSWEQDCEWAGLSL